MKLIEKVSKRLEAVREQNSTENIDLVKQTLMEVEPIPEEDRNGEIPSYSLIP